MRGASVLKQILARCAAQCSIASLYCLLPLLPLLVGILFLRWRFLRHYLTTFRKMRLHLQALRQGPIQHFFYDVLGRERSIPAQIGGSCVQCGNCCMERRCVFLEQVAKDKYQCGIYHSVWRRFSNCGSFPLNQHDIDRYACPSYFVVVESKAEPDTMSVPVTQWMPVHRLQRMK